MYETQFMIRGKVVCREAWILAHNISKETFRTYYNKFKDGAVEVEHGNTGKKQVMAKTADCTAWMHFFFHAIGDSQPDSGAIHLPSCFRKIDIYRKICEENKLMSIPSVSLSHFYNIWEKEFKHVIIPKVCFH